MKRSDFFERVSAVRADMPEVKKIFCRRESVSLPHRERETHKGDYGKILIVAGSVGYTGAPNLCSHAAVRAGAGLVYLGVPRDIWSVCAVKNSEAMPFPLPCDGTGRLSQDALSPLREYYSRCNVLALGPGLGRSEELAALCRSLVREFPGKIVLDADGLWAVSRSPEILREAQGDIIITPHEGEFARLGGSVENGRAEGAWMFTQKYGCITVLKGHRTVVAHPAGRLYSIEAGNPGMSKGGSGDVLTGITAAFAGQMDSEKAAVTACAVHAGAGDACAEERGEYGMTPSDIIDRLPYILREITEE